MKDIKNIKRIILKASTAITASIIAIIIFCGCIGCIPVNKFNNDIKPKTSESEIKVTGGIDCVFVTKEGKGLGFYFYPEQVAADKVWELAFETPINIDGFTEEHLFIREFGSDESVQVYFYAEKSGKSVKIHPPDGGYLPGREYEIVLRTGAPLVNMTFDGEASLIFRTEQAYTVTTVPLSISLGLGKSAVFNLNTTDYSEIMTVEYAAKYGSIDKRGLYVAPHEVCTDTVAVRVTTVNGERYFEINTIDVTSNITAEQSAVHISEMKAEQSGRTLELSFKTEIQGNNINSLQMLTADIMANGVLYDQRVILLTNDKKSVTTNVLYLTDAGNIEEGSVSFEIKVSPLSPDYTIQYENGNTKIDVEIKGLKTVSAKSINLSTAKTDAPILKAEKNKESADPQYKITCKYPAIEDYKDMRLNIYVNQRLYIQNDLPSTDVNGGEIDFIYPMTFSEDNTVVTAVMSNGQSAEIMLTGNEYKAGFDVDSFEFTKSDRSLKAVIYCEETEYPVMCYLDGIETVYAQPDENGKCEYNINSETQFKYITFAIAPLLTEDACNIDKDSRMVSFIIDGEERYLIPLLSSEGENYNPTSVEYKIDHVTLKDGILVSGKPATFNVGIIITGNESLSNYYTPKLSVNNKDYDVKIIDQPQTVSPIVVNEFVFEFTPKLEMNNVERVGVISGGAVTESFPFVFSYGDEVMDVCRYNGTFSALPSNTGMVTFNLASNAYLGIADAKVVIKRGNITYEGMTDVGGYVTFINLPFGHYEASFTHPKCSPRAYSFDINSNNIVLAEVLYMDPAGQPFALAGMDKDQDMLSDEMEAFLRTEPENDDHDSDGVTDGFDLSPRIAPVIPEFRPINLNDFILQSETDTGSRNLAHIKMNLINTEGKKENIIPIDRTSDRKTEWIRPIPEASEATEILRNAGIISNKNTTRIELATVNTKIEKDTTVVSTNMPLFGLKIPFTASETAKSSTIKIQYSDNSLYSKMAETRGFPAFIYSIKQNGAVIYNGYAIPDSVAMGIFIANFNIPENIKGINLELILTPVYLNETINEVLVSPENPFIVVSAVVRESDFGNGSVLKEEFANSADLINPPLEIKELKEYAQEKPENLKVSDFTALFSVFDEGNAGYMLCEYRETIIYKAEKVNGNLLHAAILYETKLINNSGEKFLQSVDDLPSDSLLADEKFNEALSAFKTLKTHALIATDGEKAYVAYFTSQRGFVNLYMPDYELSMRSGFGSSFTQYSMPTSAMMMSDGAGKMTAEWLSAGYTNPVSRSPMEALIYYGRSLKVNKYFTDKGIEFFKNTDSANLPAIEIDFISKITTDIILQSVNSNEWSLKVIADLPFEKITPFIEAKTFAKLIDIIAMKYPLLVIAQ